MCFCFAGTLPGVGVCYGSEVSDCSGLLTSEETGGHCGPGDKKQTRRLLTIILLVANLANTKSC